MYTTNYIRIADCKDKGNTLKKEKTVVVLKALPLENTWVPGEVCDYYP